MEVHHVTAQLNAPRFNTRNIQQALDQISQVLAAAVDYCQRISLPLIQLLNRILSTTPGKGALLMLGAYAGMRASGLVE